MSRFIQTSVALWMAILFVGCAEYLPFAAGALKDTVTPTPASWDEVAAASIIQLESNPSDPYSVNLWVVEIQGDLFVFAGDNLSQWVENIQTDRNVRVAAHGKIYELSATRVTDPTLFELFAEAWKDKYGNRPRNENVDETYLYRLR